MKTKLSHDLKKALNGQSKSRKQSKNLSDSISLIADRVLDSREELKGFFRSQIAKLQREQRLMEEAEELNKQKERILAEANGNWRVAPFPIPLIQIYLYRGIHSK
jgi:hypothetical protein